MPLFRQGFAGAQSGEPVDPLPHYIRPNESPATAPELAGRYPLSLISPKSHAFVNSNFGNLPAQIAQAGEQQLVLLHPDDAASRGIAAGKPIRVFNDRGTFEAVATLSADVKPGVVVAPAGYWHRSQRPGATVHALTPTAFADLGCAPTSPTCWLKWLGSKPNPVVPRRRGPNVVLCINTKTSKTLGSRLCGNNSRTHP